MIATALVAAIGDASQFANGRQLAASLGLTSKQHSSGGKDRLLGISKRGDAYLRTLMPWCAVGTAHRQIHRRSTQPVGRPFSRALTSQCGRYCFGEQNCTHGLGNAAQRY